MKLTDIIPQRDYIFEACITIDGRYMVIQDEVFDMREQQSLGNVWSSLDVFKTMFKNVMVENIEYKEIRQEILSLPILESNDTLYGIKNYLISEGFWDNTWLGNELKSSYKGVKNFAFTSYQKAKELGVSVSQGDWSKILRLLHSGLIYFLRSLKSALYSTIGITVDAMLIATGIGKGVQWIPWSLVLSLDIYQFVSNNYTPEEADLPTWAKLLDIGFDVIGMVTAGSLAKGGRALTKPLVNAAKTGDKMAIKKIVNQKPVRTIITKIIESAGKAPGILNKALVFLSKKFKAGAKFISNIIKYVSSVLTSMVNSLKKLIGYVTPTSKVGNATVAGAGTLGISYGIDKAVSGGGDPLDELGDAIIASASY